METNNYSHPANVEGSAIPEHYNPNQLVTYKVIENGIATYPTVKVTDIEWDLYQKRSNTENLSQYISKVNQLESVLVEWIENANDAETIVSEICSIFGFNPTKEIEFEATATITGRVLVSLSQLADFDIEDIDLTVYADSHSHDIEVDVEVDNYTIL